MSMSRIASTLGTLGSTLSVMGCAMCFPLAAGVGAALGLGFLSAWEGALLNRWLPLFAVLVLLAQWLAGFAHRRWGRLLLGSLGPILVLLSLYVFCWSCEYSSWTLHAGIIGMLLVAGWDLLAPPTAQCRVAPSGAQPGAAEPKTRETHA